MIQSIALVVVILLAFYLTFNSLGQLSLGSLISKPTTNLVTATDSANQTTSNIKQVSIGGNLINVEVVDSQTARSQGLSGRESLDPNSGMLFIFPTKGVYQFWMKDMKFGLDFIFINDAKITDLIKNVPAPSDPNHLNIYQPSTAGNTVLEVNAGYVDKHKIKLTDLVEIIKN